MGKYNPKSLLNENLYIQDSFSEFWITFEKIEMEPISTEVEELKGEVKIYNRIANLFIDDKHDLNILTNRNIQFATNKKNLLFQRAKI